MINPKKSLSQNFLKDKNILNKIAKLTNLNNKIILEVGPGYGSLTDIILKQNPKKIYLVEKDNNICSYLHDKYKLNKTINISNIDILKFDIKNFKNIIIISNLPYNLGTKIILNFLKHNKNISEMIFMIQKEVAYKFDYKFGKINKFKFMTKISSNYKRCFNVSNNVFFPKPKVISTVVQFKMKKKDIDWIKINNFTKLIFKNKRKKINNNIKIKNKQIIDIGNKRVEQLNMNELFNIYDFF